MPARLEFRQECVLSFIAGECFPQSFFLGLFGLGILLLFRWRRPRRCLVLAAAFAAGLLLAAPVLRLPRESPADVPVPAEDVLFTGRIDETGFLAGGRTRLVLSDVHWTEWRNRPRASGSEGTNGGGFSRDGMHSLSSRVLLTLSAADAAACGGPVAGGTVSGRGRTYPVSGMRNPGLSGSVEYWKSRGVAFQLRLRHEQGRPAMLRMDASGAGASALARRAAMERFSHAVHTAFSPDTGPSPGAALLPALVFGDRRLVSARVSDLFSAAGLSHSLALSGLHLAIAAMAGVLLAKAVTMVFPGVLLRMPFRMLAAVAGLPVALLQLFMGGAPFSLARAFFMMGAGVLFLMRRSPWQSLDVFFPAVALLFTAWPSALFDISARLSVLAVGGLLLAAPFCVRVHRRLVGTLCGHGVPGFPSRAAAACADVLLASFFAQAAVFPVIAGVFGTVSFSSWLNVVWMPLLTFVTLPGSVLGALCAGLALPDCVSSGLVRIAAFPADAMIALLEFMDGRGLLWNVQIPGLPAAVWAGTAACMAVLPLLARDRRRVELRVLLGAGVLAAAAGMAWAVSEQVADLWRGTLRMTVLDVGMGQSVVVSHGGRRILVDGGGSPSPLFDPGRSIVAPFLARGRLPRLDAVFVSHCDTDHAAGLEWILENFSVGALYWSAVSAKRAEDGGKGAALRKIAGRRGIPEKIVGKGDVVRLSEDAVVEVLSPDAGLSVPSPRELSSNDASLALRIVRRGEGMALLCGDMEKKALGALSRSGAVLQAGVLVVPHHGAASSLNEGLYDAVRPSLAVVSAARWNHWGFPSRSVREALERRGVPLLCTGDRGAVVITWDGMGSGAPEAVSY